ncbi:hypothetical protein D3C71_1697570 [compost metagenome]
MAAKSLDLNWATWISRRWYSASMASVSWLSVTNEELMAEPRTWLSDRLLRRLDSKPSGVMPWAPTSAR